MAKGFLYVYERIYKGENEMQAEFRKIPVNGKRTSVADQKRIRKVISDNGYRIAKECKVLVGYPSMRIEGTKVNLGAASIMLPDCRLIDIEELKKIERGGEMMKEVYIKLVDGTEKTLMADLEITNDAVKIITADGSGATIYKKFISDLRVTTRYDDPIPRCGDILPSHITPWDAPAPRYKEGR